LKDCPIKVLPMNFTPDELIKSLRRNIDEVIPKLYIGNISAANDLKVLQEKQITHVVNCCFGELPKFPTV
jgi:hypothetical protein